MTARRRMLSWSLLTALLCALGASSCLISFDHYAEGDVCEAARDAGIRPEQAPDPVLRGCDAGPPPSPENEASAGAAGTDERP